MRARSISWSGITLTALLTGATAGCSYMVNSTSAAVPPGASGGGASSVAAPPAPLAVATAKMPGSQGPRPSSSAAAGSGSGSGAGGAAGVDSYKGSLLLDASGAQLTSWNQTGSYCPETKGTLANGTVATDSSGAVNLTTSGKAGSCVALISPGAYSGVIEADINFPGLPGKPGTMANWAGFWMTNGPAWPVDGELDGVEVEPVNAANAVTWHSGTRRDEFSASTSGFAPVQLPVNGNNMSPGWHVVDMVYTKGYFAVYYDGDLFTSYTSSNIPGAPLNVYFTMTNTPNTSAIVKVIGSPPINSSPSSATMSVRYLKVWSYR